MSRLTFDVIRFGVLLLIVHLTIANDDKNVICSDVYSQLAQHGVAPPNLHLHPPGNGSDVCGSGPCCSPSMTESLLHKGLDHLNNIVQKETLALLNVIQNAKEALSESFVNALSSSEYECVGSFQRSYPRLMKHIRKPLRELFASLMSSLSNVNEGLVRRALSNFWNDLFPIVYHSSVHSHLAPFLPSYVDCLKRISSNISPWKVVPTLVDDALIKGLTTVQLMYKVLSVSHNVVLNSRKFEVPRECASSAAHLYFCGLCHGTNERPCHEFCLNVARGCLAPLVEIDGAWNDMASAATKVEEAIRNSGLIQLLKDLPDRFSDSIMIAMESSSKLQKLVWKQCGPHQHRKSSELEDRSYTTRLENHTEKPQHHDSDLLTSGSLLELKASESAAALSGSRHFWVRLSDGPCSHLPVDQSNCWNGHEISSYSRPTAGPGLSAQKYNPEVQITSHDTFMYTLADQLRTVNRIVTKKLNWMPESDSYRLSEEFEGSGIDTSRKYPTIHDDEDAEDDGVEGSGHFYPRPKAKPTSRPEKKRPRRPSQTSSTQNYHSSKIYLFFITTAFLAYT